MPNPTGAMRCRQLPIQIANGAWNMAADEAMLESAVKGEASLRFYGWSEATVSLGYFQPDAVRHAEGGLSNLPYVRRATGGNALVHHHELTYALALPPGERWQPRAKPWLPRFHQVIAAALGSFGITTESVTPGNEKKLGPVLCFQHQTPEDLVLSGHKIVGSAQRKQRGALLQHGAILFARSEFAPQLPGLSDLTSFSTDSVDTLAQKIGDTLAFDTGWLIEPADWTSEEEIRRDELSLTKYSQPSWNAKR